MDQKETAEFISNNLRLRTLPLGVKFLTRAADLPPKARRPSQALGKKITICQAVTMGRLYGWTVGITREDLICVPAMIAFGFTKAADPGAVLGGLFCRVDFPRDKDASLGETGSMTLLQSGEYEALAIAPLAKGEFDPDTVVIYGNPGQMARCFQASTYDRGKRVQGNFGGKVECTEYLVAPFKTGAPRASVPGAGDRIFSMTQDDEMAFSLPGSGLEGFVRGLKEAGKKIGARYPITFYQNFQPDFPQPYKDMAVELDSGDFS